MKRMIDYKEFKELENLAQETKQALEALENGAAKITDESAQYDYPEELDDIETIQEIYDNFDLVKFAYGVAIVHKAENAMTLSMIADDGKIYIVKYEYSQEAWGVDTYNVYDLAKKLYCHPVAIKIDLTNYKLYAMCLIFNDSSTAFTWSTFKSYTQNFSGTISLNGSLYDKTDSKFLNCLLLRVQGANSLSVYGTYLDGVDVTDWGKYNLISLQDNQVDFVDNVNQIY